jgi:hypothetical protein
MLPHEFEIDQRFREEQDTISEQLYVDGFSDAMDGKPPQSEEEPYKLGYAQGTVHLHCEHQTNWVCDNYNPCYNDECLEDYGEF